MLCKLVKFFNNIVTHVENLEQYIFVLFTVLRILYEFSLSLI